MAQSKRSIELGIQSETVASGDHIAYFWETSEEFAEAVGFLEAGLNKRDFCVIFGHEAANEKVCHTLAEKGFDCDQLERENRLAIVGGQASGEAMLAHIGSLFSNAVRRGARLIRLLGNIGWGGRNWPNERELLAFEAKVTTAAKKFPSVVVCMYDVGSLPGRVILHGAFETHPLTFCGNLLRENPYHVAVEEFLKRTRQLEQEGSCVNE